MKPILIICCSREEDKRTLRLYSSLKGFDTKEVRVIYHTGNVTALPEIYNRYINYETMRKHDIVLFVHDDLYIDDYKLRGKLYNSIQQYDIVGIAGATKLSIKAPTLWHIMSPPDARRGFVHHPVEIREDVWANKCSSYGYTPDRVIVIDGLFMAVNLRSVLKTEWIFNEQFDFHHYDLASCLDAHKLGLKIGVTPIHTIHSSPGLKNINDIPFQSSQQKFLDIYGTKR